MSTFDRWHSETQSAWLYREIARSEKDPAKSQLFTRLATTADDQAAILAGDLARAHEPQPTFRPGLRVRFVAWCAQRFGVRATRPLLAALKVRGLSVYSGHAPAGHVMPVSVHEVGARHKRSKAGGNLRAIVFGANDGLVSNTCLIFGVAGANASPSVVLTTGAAGLVAGALSMASGEWVSVRSQRELCESQLAEEREELERYPDEEAEELALIYEARGVPIEDARKMTRAMLSNREQLLETLAREELGLDPQALGSPWGAAISSFFAFALGAVIPLVPFLLESIPRPELAAAVLSAVSLFGIGVAVALFSGRSALVGGARMLAIGTAVGALTFAIGHLFGAEIAG